MIPHAFDMFWRDKISLLLLTHPKQLGSFATQKSSVTYWPSCSQYMQSCLQFCCNRISNPILVSKISSTQSLFLPLPVPCGSEHPAASLYLCRKSLKSPDLSRFIQHFRHCSSSFFSSLIPLDHRREACQPQPVSAN